MAKLTPKQERFIKEYLIDLNATQAAIRAGYSKKTAESIGYENLRKPQIEQAIARYTKKHADKVGLSVDEVLEGIRYIYDNNKEEQPQTAIRALDLAGKYHKLFTDRVEVAVTEMPEIVLKKHK